MNAPHERLTFDPVQQLRRGAFLFHNRWVDYCQTFSPDGQDRCFRARGHGGRHAHVGVTGYVWKVWGQDVHADVRGKSRPLSYGPDFDPTDQEMPAWGSLAASWAQSMRGRS